MKNYGSVEDAANLIREINTNDTLYESFLQHKLEMTISNQLLQKSVLKDHPISAFECFVCEQIQRQSSTSNGKNSNLNIYECPKPKSPEKENTWDQHWDVGKCQSKALEILLSKNTPYTSTAFEELWNMLWSNKNC